MLDETALKSLNQACVRREYKVGETVFATGDPGDGIFCIAAGSVGLRKIDAEGNMVMLRMAYPGDTLGYRAFICEREHQTTCEALEPAIACFFRRESLNTILDSHPQLGRQFVKRASEELDQADDAIFQNAVMTNRVRFLHLLRELARRHGRTEADGSRRFVLPLSRRDLASMIGTRHETLSRIIARLEQDGIAKFSGRHVQILSMPRLPSELEPQFGA